MPEIADVAGPLYLQDLRWLPSEALLARCRRHLKRQRSVLWSEAFDVHSEESRQQAAQWLAEQIMGVLKDGGDA